ncbi:MAG: pyruvate dehydrogenase (acetyl-transferring) E1 component subunit alpha [Gammaproteobacteria bacterium]|nr:MAG: pyruvate dehydrogenase (acetyl-transferring) E1 component subunit alpha [Gammaproteobacteria bacterium]
MPVTIASFKIEYYQFLSPDGRLISDDVPPLATDWDELQSLYRLMVTTRVFDKKAVALQRTGKMGTYASCLGHEATHIAMGSAMRPEDCYAPSYREYGTQFCRGVKMSEVLLYWGGDERGSNFSGPKHDFAWSVPIATQCMHAAGAALAFKLRGEQRVAVSQVGDGGSSKGDFLEAINAASAFQLPLVLVIINNQWAISVPRSKQNTAKTLAQKGIAGGLPSIQVDGNDIIACRWAMENAIEQAREGGGPTIIEMITYRLTDHTTADDARRYRSEEEVENAWQMEPIKRLRTYLKDQGVWDDKKEKELLEQAGKEVAAAVEEYLATGDPGIESMFDYLYENMPAELEAQRARALEELG